MLRTAARACSSTVRRVSRVTALMGRCRALAQIRADVVAESPQHHSASEPSVVCRWRPPVIRRSPDASRGAGRFSRRREVGPQAAHAVADVFPEGVRQALDGSGNVILHAGEFVASPVQLRQAGRQ